jgi:serine/threonine protein kinase/tetratricopeptide (TPR) repeat protein
VSSLNPDKPVRAVADSTGQGSKAAGEPAEPAPSRRSTISYAAQHQQVLSAHHPVALVEGLAFEVRDEIARGGMGVVHAARDLSLNRIVAIKMLHPELAASADAVSRFVAEARITARLPHPGVPPIHALGTLPDGRPFLAMRLIQGRTLAALLRERPDRSHELPRWLQVFEQVCQTAGYAHAQGIVHRDLKPGNVMVGAFGEVQVMDWGLAKDMGSVEPVAGKAASVPDAGGAATVVHSQPGRGLSNLTLPGTVLGTPAYMAPEQARGQTEQVDARADVFALGGILCEILTGRPPFQGTSRTEIIQRAAAADLSEAHARLAGCGGDAELIGLAQRCLAAQPGGRPSDGKAVADAVAAYRAGVEDRLRRAEKERAAAEVKAGELRKRRRVQLALVVAIGLLLMGAGAVAWWADRQEAERQAEEARVEGERVAERHFQEQMVRQGVTAAMRLANTLRAQSRFREAADSLDQAGQLLAGDEAADLRPLVVQAKADVAFVRELNAVRLKKAVWNQALQSFDTAAAPPAYRAKFAAHGLDFAHGEAALLATRVKESSIHQELVDALDDWSVDELDRNLRSRLLEVARCVDPSPWKDRFRDPSLREDATGLAKLAGQADLVSESPLILVTLAELMKRQRLEAGKLLVAAQANHPSDFELAFALALEFHGQDPKRAIAYYQTALAIRPENSAVLTNLGLLHAEAGDYDRALLYYRQALRADADDPVAQFNFGAALHKKGDRARAIAAYRKALQLDPNYDLARLNLGTALAQQGDLDGAVAHFTAVVKARPKDPTAHVNLGLALQNKGDHAGALAAYRRAKILAPLDPMGPYNLGSLLRIRGDLGGAKVEFTEALRLAPDDPRKYHGLGLALRDLGEFGDALGHFKQAQELAARQSLDMSEFDSRVKECETLIKLDAKLTAVLAGTAEPKGAPEFLAFATISRLYHRRFTDAVRFYKAAFAAEPRLPNQFARGYRANAARAAVQAATGSGSNAPPPAARPLYRKQALAWLSADLGAWEKAVGKSEAERCRAMQDWLTDPVFATVRDPQFLSALPAEQAAEWEAFWLAVRELRDRK